MANAKQCDICGHFYAAHKESKRLRGCGYLDTAAIMIYDPDDKLADFDPDVGKVTLETCSVCIKRIQDFIEELKKPNDEL